MKFFNSDMLWKYLVPGAVVFTLANSPLANGEGFVDLSTGNEIVSKRAKPKSKKKLVKKSTENKKSVAKASKQDSKQAETPVVEAKTQSGFLEDTSLPALSNEAYVDHDWMISFYPVMGWELKKIPGMALTMTEPVGLKTQKLVKKGYDKASDADFVETSQTTYKRSVTVASIEGGVPFNQKRMDDFEQSLLDTFGKKMGLQGFTMVNKPELFDHRGEKDAIVAYTQFSTAKYDLKQMHVLVGGAKNQVHLTYTDIADHFETRTDFINKVWSSMTSVNVEGTSPKPLWDKIEKYIPFAGAAVLLLFLLVMIQKMQLKNNMRRAIAEIDLQEGEYKEYKSETVWNIGNAEPQTNWMYSRVDAPKKVANAPSSSRAISGMAPISNIFGSQF